MAYWDKTMNPPTGMEGYEDYIEGMSIPIKGNTQQKVKLFKDVFGGTPAEVRMNAPEYFDSGYMMDNPSLFKRDALDTRYGRGEIPFERYMDIYNGRMSPRVSPYEMKDYGYTATPEMFRSSLYEPMQIGPTDFGQQFRQDYQDLKTKRLLEERQKILERQLNQERDYERKIAHKNVGAARKTDKTSAEAIRQYNGQRTEAAKDAENWQEYIDAAKEEVQKKYAHLRDNRGKVTKKQKRIEGQEIRERAAEMFEKGLVPVSGETKRKISSFETAQYFPDKKPLYDAHVKTTDLYNKYKKKMGTGKKGVAAIGGMMLANAIPNMSEANNTEPYYDATDGYIEQYYDPTVEEYVTKQW